MIGRTNTGGGGGGGLNFQVVGNPQPTNPKENTIWLNTAKKITGKYFQTEQPKDMQPGEVWISTGTSSTVAFNATKKDTVMLYPISAKQMGHDGVLVDVEAKSYQGGAWVDWIPDGYLFYSGVGAIAQFTLKKESNAVVNIGKEYVEYNRTSTSSSQATYYVQKDFTGYNWLKAMVHETARGERDDVTAALAYSTAVPAANRNGYTRTAEVVFSVTNEPKVYKIDISAQSGTFYVAITGGMIGKVYDIWLEK